MIETRDLTEFYRSNDPDIRRYLRFKGIHDSDDIDDISQDFYCRCKAEALLEKFDPNRGCFTNYVFVILVTCISHFFKNQMKPNYEPEPPVPNAWERIHEFQYWLADQSNAPQLINDFHRRILGKTDRTCANTILYCQAVKVYNSI